MIDQTLISITEANSLKEWLISISDSNLDSLGFCRLCYEARGSTLWKAVEQRAKNSSIHEDNTSCEARFARIRHFMGRIGSHLKAARVLVEAGRQYPGGIFLGGGMEVMLADVVDAKRGNMHIDGFDDILNELVPAFGCIKPVWKGAERSISSCHGGEAGSYK